MKKKFLSVITITSFLSFCLYLDLFTSYNILTGTIDQLNDNLKYPQCEFDGIELDKLNRITADMGFSVIYVDCNKFYTKGMRDYYQIMNLEISKSHGEDWIKKMYELYNNEAKK